ncbi:MAG: hypothetical protein M3Y17_05680 [Actinomycetota bacterium]|nr:hypothetical protein [Actinomycetota bacterium]
MRKLVATAALGFGLALPAAASARILPAVPTEFGHPQVRPHLIDYTGDGSAFLGGFTRHHALHKSSPLADFGRLHWTTYNKNEGRAYGADWIDNFIPDGAAGTFHPFKVTVHVYRPRAGVFTRMTIVEQGRSYTFHAHGRDLWF